MLNHYYHNTIETFLQSTTEEIIGKINLSNQFDSTQNQNKAWKEQIVILKTALDGLSGSLFFEFSIPRMGRRVDCLIIVQNIVYVIEFKVGECEYLSQHIDQVWDYALDLKNFHAPSHQAFLAPILVATDAQKTSLELIMSNHNDNVLFPVKCNAKSLRPLLASILDAFSEKEQIDSTLYAAGSYKPTPTIVEAAVALYNNHSVEEITRSDSGAKNLRVTTDYISKSIDYAKANHRKVICFVTGVPGAGKTLVGLKVATEHLDKEKGNTSVFLSGNAPLVAVLQEALTRDKVNREREAGNKMTKQRARDGVKAFIQIIHHYRDAYLVDPKAPYDHVAIFDEAQRAWDKEQTVKFMRTKKGQSDFDYSEPEFLISCLDRHEDWAVIVCLVGGGQEINTGEAGISEWIEAIHLSFPDWETHISPNLTDQEYNAIESINKLNLQQLVYNQDLHLSVSMRSFRAEHVSLLVKQILDRNIEAARQTLKLIQDKYPIALTRDLKTARKWLKGKARGTERYGIVVSSQAYRLKPLAIDVKSPMDPVHWFLDDKDDVRSSYYLEDVATEFQIQGLELDWTCVAWDGDLRYNEDGWETFSFVGSKWQHIRKDERKKYLINAYRVLLTRARQGMIIVVPEGSSEDPTRSPEYYDQTFEYLKGIGLEIC